MWRDWRLPTVGRRVPKIGRLGERIRKLESLSESTGRRLRRRPQRIKESTASSVSNSTSRRNPIRSCRIANPVDYHAKASSFHTSRPHTHINTLGQILTTYEQLPHAQFPSTFAQITLSEAIDRANQSELNEAEWQYESPPPSEDFSSEGSISIDSCQLFGLRVRTRSPSASSETIQSRSTTAA